MALTLSYEWINHVWRPNQSQIYGKIMHPMYYWFEHELNWTKGNGTFWFNSSFIFVRLFVGCSQSAPIFLVCKPCWWLNEHEHFKIQNFMPGMFHEYEPRLLFPKLHQLCSQQRTMHFAMAKWNSIRMYDTEIYLCQTPNFLVNSALCENRSAAENHKTRGVDHNHPTWIIFDTWTGGCILTVQGNALGGN